MTLLVCFLVVFAELDILKHLIAFLEAGSPQARKTPNTRTGSIIHSLSTELAFDAGLRASNKRKPMHTNINLTHALALVEYLF